MKLIPHVLDTDSPDALLLVEQAQSPAVILANAWGDAARYAAMPHHPLIIGRVVVDEEQEPKPDQAGVSLTDPLRAARDYYAATLDQKVRENPAIQAWQGPKERVCKTEAGMLWFARFEAERTRLLDLAGKISLVGNFSTGQPEINLWKFFEPALQAIRQAPRPGYLALDEYSAPTREDNGWGVWWVGRFQQAPRDVPKIIAEHGSDDLKEVRDEHGNLIWPQSFPWSKQFQNLEQYVAWLVAMDRRYRQHADIFAVAGFTFGRGWPLHNVEGTGLAQQLLAYARTHHDLPVIVNPPPPLEQTLEQPMDTYQFQTALTPAQLLTQIPDLRSLARVTPIAPPAPAPSHPTGKGMFIWQLDQSAGGAPAAIAAKAKAAGLSWVAIKIHDGAASFNRALLPAVVAALKAAAIDVWGWGYVYLNDPSAEAQRAAVEMLANGLRGYFIDGEGECKGKPAQAAQFAATLRQRITSPIGLCSYRYPTLHADFPWKEFAAICDFHAPQVYWLQATSPTAPSVQLARSVTLLRAVRDLPVVPVGCAFPWNGWNPTIAQLADFHAAARAGLPGVGWWSWQSAEQTPAFWDAIAGQGW